MPAHRGDHATDAGSLNEPGRPASGCGPAACREPRAGTVGGDRPRFTSKTTPTAGRRSFLRHALGLGGLAAVGGLAGCADSVGVDDLGADDDDGATPDESDLRLQAGMAIGLGSTAFAGQVGPGEVDPDEPGGGRLVTIDDVEPGVAVTLSWRRTVERERTPDATPAGVGEPTPTPAVEVVEEAGTIEATGLAAAHEPFLPMYWRPGDVTTASSAMWLSREAYQELRETRETAWSRDVLTRISRLGEDAVDRIRRGAAEVDEVVLHAEADLVDVELAIDGQAATVDAIEAYDTFGNAYRILDRERNPLILRFTYDAVSTGFAGIDAGLWALIKTVFSGYQVASIDRP